jgi:drug/metabolite transporter (DMT)-like permease
MALDGYITTRMASKTIVALGVTLLLWASAFAGIRAALQGFSPFHLALDRFLVASAILAAVAFWKKTRLPDRADLSRVLLTGFFGIAVYNVALNYGELTVTAGAAGFIVNTVPIFTTLLSLLFLKERIRLFGWLGMIVSFAGVSLIAIADSSSLELNKGAFIILCAAVCQSLYFVLQKPLLKKYSPFEVVCYAVWVGTIGMLVLIPGSVGQLKSASPAAILAVLYLGIFPSTIAYVCWSYVLAKMPASRASAFLYLVPAIAVTIAFVWLKEAPSWLLLVGGCLALGGVVLVNSVGQYSPFRSNCSRNVRRQSPMAEDMKANCFLPQK